MNNPTIKPQVVNNPFTNFCMSIGAIPTSYQDSLDYYETLLWLIKYLEETVIPTLNNNGEAIAELQGLYIELKDYVEHYFDNLDVQEEINNKLDDMVEQGTLQEIIADYLNSKAVFGFDNVASMKQATNLIDGSYTQTLGYYSKNDGGKSLYKIREITNLDIVDEMTIIALSDENLIAELIIPGTLYPEMLGAYGDGTHDDTNALQKAISISNVTLRNGKTYIVSDTLEISNEFSIYGNDSIIKYNGDVTTEDYLININIGTDRRTQRKSTFNIKVECDEKINGVIINNSIGNDYNLTIFNALYGLKIPSSTSCFENNINAQIDYNKGYGEIGCNVLRTDNIFNNLTVINYKVALHNVGGTNYTTFHAWLDRNASDIYDISTMLEDNTNGYGAYINYFYCDTYRIGVKTTNYAYVHISDYLYLVNKNEIGDEVALANVAYTFKRSNQGQLLVDNFKTYETYAYLNIIDTTTTDNTNYKIVKANISFDITNKMSEKEVVFPMNISDTTSVIFSKLPQTLQNAYSDGVIYFQPYGKNGTLGYIATHYQQARIYLFYGGTISNISQWRKIQSEYV